QAEDGIRDRNVTGVQTCALPILLTRTVMLSAGASSKMGWPVLSTGTSPVSVTGTNIYSSSIISAGSSVVCLMYSKRSPGLMAEAPAVSTRINSPLRSTASTISTKWRGFEPTSYSRTARSATENPSFGDSKSSIISTTVGVTVASPSKRPAVSAEVTTESAPDCKSKWRFADSRTDATILADGASSRTAKVHSTAVSSMDGVTTTACACATPAIFNTSALVPEP